MTEPEERPVVIPTQNVEPGLQVKARAALERSDQELREQAVAALQERIGWSTDASAWSLGRDYYNRRAVKCTIDGFEFILADEAKMTVEMLKSGMGPAVLDDLAQLGQMIERHQPKEPPQPSRPAPGRDQRKRKPWWHRRW